jgi:predicted acylesterase/phospholipase RssA
LAYLASLFVRGASAIGQAEDWILIKDRIIQVMPHSQQPRQAVVLSGGGAYGAYEVGVMKALCTGKCRVTEGIALDPDIFTGTSVGNFNAAAMVMHKGDAREAVARLEHIWLNEICDKGDGRGNAVFRIRCSPAGYLDPFPPTNPLEAMQQATRDLAFLATEWAARTSQFLTSNDTLSHRALGLVNLSAFVCVEEFERMVERNIDPRAIRESKKSLRIVATNWKTGQPKVFPNEEVTDEHGRAVVLASAAIPGIFPPVKVGSDVYVDGGVVTNTPINFAVDAGAAELHIVDLDPDVKSIPIERLQNTVDTFDRVYTSMLATKIHEDLQTAKWINRGLEVIERAEAGENVDSEGRKNLLRVVGQIYEKATSEDKQYRKLTIHRYHPDRSLGGAMGMLNFHQAPVRELIARGFEDAQRHDCRTSHCVIPRHHGGGRTTGASA